MVEDFKFDQEKFKDAVHFTIAHAVENYGAEALGNVKLHKILYFSDFLTYLETMQPLTGADYLRWFAGDDATSVIGMVLESIPDADRFSLASAMEFVLDGLHQHSKLAKEEEFGTPEISYRDMVGSIFAGGFEEEEEEDEL